MSISCKLISLVTLILSLQTVSLWAAAPVEMTADEYTWYRTYVNLKDAPKLANLPDKQKRVKIAQSINITVAQLDGAIAKGEAKGEGIAERTVAAVRVELDKGPLKGRIKDVTINTDTEQAVIFIKWQAANALDFDKEACQVAAAVKDGGHIVSLIVLWAVNNNDVTVFSAKVGRSAFTRINQASINSFASTRYIKMFEEVKRGPQQNQGK